MIISNEHIPIKPPCGVIRMLWVGTSSGAIGSRCFYGQMREAIASNGPILLPDEHDI